MEMMVNNVTGHGHVFDQENDDLEKWGEIDGEWVLTWTPTELKEAAQLTYRPWSFEVNSR